MSDFTFRQKNRISQNFPLYSAPGCGTISYCKSECPAAGVFAAKSFVFFGEASSRIALIQGELSMSCRVLQFVGVAALLLGFCPNFAVSQGISSNTALDAKALAQRVDRIINQRLLQEKIQPGARRRRCRIGSALARRFDRPHPHAAANTGLSGK